MPNMHRARKKIAHDNIEEEKVDRLSNLPDDLIHKILSFISIEDAVKTMALSSRYRFIWTTMPYLDFSTVWNFQKFSNLVDHCLKKRNNQIDVFSLKLKIWMVEFTEPCVKKLVDYAFSHNIQRFEVTATPLEKEFGLTEFPLSLFSSSESLKHLSLSDKWLITGYKLKATSILELPALTTFYLENFSFRSDDDNNCVIGLFSKCTNLKNLTLKRCTLDATSISICHPLLSNLTLDDIKSYDVVNVVAPQLENLTIRCNCNFSTQYMISAPNLASLAYRGERPLQLSTDGFHFLKDADIRVLARYQDVDHLDVDHSLNEPVIPVLDYHHHLDVDDDARQMVGLLQQLHNVKFLKFNLEITELLSKSVDLISHQPSPFVNLESLTIYPEYLETWGKVSLSTQVKNYLLDSSPGASLTMISADEIIEERNFASAQKEMAKLRVLLEQEKANNIKTYDRANTNRSGETPVDQGDMQLQIGGNYELIESCWEDLSLQLTRRKDTACRMIYLLKTIEGLLTQELPATKRAMMQARFSSLRAEADTVMSELMKMQCDENQSRISACYHEVATSTLTMEPPS